MAELLQYAADLVSGGGSARGREESKQQTNKGAPQSQGRQQSIPGPESAPGPKNAYQAGATGHGGQGSHERKASAAA